MSNGLLNLQTDLKSLRYGEETPYIVKDLNNPPSTGTISLEVNRRVDDLFRIAKMMIDKPGIKFLANEALLKQVDLLKKLERADGKTVFILKQIKDTVLQVVKTAASTLIQVPVNGTGLHFVRSLRTDTYIRPANETSAFAELFGAGGVEGAPYALRGDKIPTNPNIDGYVHESIHASDEDYTVSPTVQKTVHNYSNYFIFASENQYDPLGNNLPARAKLGDQGKRRGTSKSLNEYWFASSPVNIYTRQFAKETDSINALDIQDKKLPAKDVKDFIKFRFQVITPTSTRVLYFRAFLDSFADNYTGQWNQVKYLGRAEDMQIYGGFQRKISLSFKIAAATRAEMKPLYRKMLYLASSTAPTYSENGNFMRGTIVKLTVGDYLYELPGVMNSVNYTWQQEYPWEIAPGGNAEPRVQDEKGQFIEGSNKTMQELPMIMDCSIDFTPIHTFTPTTGLRRYFTAGRENTGGTDNPDNLNNGFFIDNSNTLYDPLKIEKEELAKDPGLFYINNQIQQADNSNVKRPATDTPTSPEFRPPPEIEEDFIRPNVPEQSASEINASQATQGTLRGNSGLA